MAKKVNRWLRTPRVCKNCGREARPGPLPFEWEVHTGAESDTFTCSSVCRMMAGLPDDKVRTYA